MRAARGRSACSAGRVRVETRGPSRRLPCRPTRGECHAGSIKTFFDGVHKVRTPAETCRIVEQRLGGLQPRMMARYERIDHVTGVPHYRVHGTPAYRGLVGVPLASGKGHSNEQALASGLMELSERYSCYGLLRDAPGSIRSSLKRLDRDAYSFAKFFTCFADQPVDPRLSESELADTEVTWFEGADLAGNPILIPARLIAWVLEGSNGMASGNTLEEALLHGILEVVERHCQTRVRGERLETPRIDPDTIDSDLARQLLERFAAVGEHVLIRDFSLGIGVPVIATARVLDDGTTQVTVGSATTREEALLRALCENVQTQGLMNCYAASESEHFLSDGADPVPFASIADIDNLNLRLEIETVSGLLDARGMRVLYIDATRPDLDIPAVITYVEGALFRRRGEDLAMAEDNGRAPPRTTPRRREPRAHARRPGAPASNYTIQPMPLACDSGRVSRP